MNRPTAQINLGLNLRRLRESLKLSQAAVAQGAKISQRSYVGIELSQHSSTLKIIQRLADFFKVEPADLLK